MRRVTSTDGVTLAVTEAGTPGAETIVCVHGYPDNSSTWDGVTAELGTRFHVVAYDVRGAGRSDAPRRRDAYRLDQLVDDLAAVVDAVSPDRPVHLLAHDWGSIQCWHAVTGERLAGRIASFTSVSGPSLDHAAYWIRSAPRRHVLRQLLHSAYILLFVVPRLPELLWRSGVLDRALHTRGGRGPVRPLADKINGLQLYRANMLRRPQPRRTGIPVQVLAPTRDRFVSRELQTAAPAPWTTQLLTREIDGGHWVVGTRPEVVARYTAEMIERVNG